MVRSNKSMNPRQPIFASITLLACAAALSGCGSSTSVSNLGTIETVAGTGHLGNTGNGGPATGAELYQPSCVVTDNSGNLYIGDSANYDVRKVALSSGVITLYAGTGTAGFSGNGAAATKASLYGPTACAVNAAGNLYIADEANNQIRKIDASTGVISAVAGNAADAGTAFGGFSGDGGLATLAEINHPWGMVFDSAGNLYFADTGNQRVRKVDASTGFISTIAGTGDYGNSGGGGPATKAKLSNPEQLALDHAGNLYICEQGVSVIAKLNLATGILTIVAGNGQPTETTGLGDGGPATKAGFDSPGGIALDTAGNLYISDTGNNRVRKIDATTGIISTVAGGNQGYSGDGGPSDGAQLSNPLGLSFDSTGNLYIADSGNGVVRKITP